MPKITNITEQQSNRERLNIFIDKQFCVGIRKRTFQAMKLKIGDEISCEELKDKEKFFWKQAYGEDAWKKEKIRINKVKEVIENIDNRFKVEAVGFGADSEEMIEKHPDQKGVPDLDVVKGEGDNKEIVIKVEVTGTEKLRGEGYWVRPDKIEYAESHPDEDVWIILHYAEPQELFVFIKPTAGKKYERHTIQIRDAGEIMCIFNDGDDEVANLEEFAAYIRQFLD